MAFSSDIETTEDRGSKRGSRGKSVSPLKRSWGLNTLPLARLRSQSGPEQNAPPPMPPPKSRSPVLTKKIDAALMTFEQLTARIGHEPHSDRLKGLWKRSVHYKEMRTETKSIEDACKGSLADLDEAALIKSLEDLIKAGEAYAEQHKDVPNKVSVGNDVSARARDRKELLKSVTDDPDYNAVKDHITIEQALDCKARGIRFKDCAFGTLNDSKTSRVNDKFGAGNANSVSKIEFTDGDVRVFKAEKLREDQPLDGATAIGIDKNSPHNGNRNIATSAISDLLGLKVMPKVNFGLHKDPETEKVEVGLMMGLAPGKPPARGVWEDFKTQQFGKIGELMKNRDFDGLLKCKPKVRLKPPSGPGWEKEVTKLLPPWGDTPPSKKAQAAMQEQLNGLEWCDVLTGQTDRHAQNYFVEVNGDDVKVTGIDNDMAFGKKQTKASVTKNELDARKTPPGLPSLIDKKVYDELIKKTFERDLLPQIAGLLTDEEIEASRQRFNEVKEHAAMLKEGGYVVEDWSTWQSPGEEKLSPRQFLAQLQTTAAKDMGNAEKSGGLFGRDFAKMFDEAGL